MKKDTDKLTPPAPRLIEPLEEAVVDGNAVRFAWEPVEEAVRYQLEVARDPAFSDIVFEDVFDQRTSVTLANVFPIDENTYYWRVLAFDGETWSTGEHVESFVSCSPERACGKVAQPDADESLGPVVQLMKATGVEAARETTESASMREKEHQMGVEHDRIEAGQIIGLAVAVLAALAIIIVLVVQWTDIRTQQVRRVVERGSSYPELRQLRAQDQQKLSQYGPSSDTSGVYRIPIDRAMNLMAEESYRSGNGALSKELPLSPTP